MKVLLSLFFSLLFSGGSGFAQSVDFEIGGRTGLGPRSFVELFGSEGNPSTSGTVMDEIGGETFTATFSLAVSSDDANPGIAYRNLISGFNFIGVRSDLDWQPITSSLGDRVTIRFLEIDNPMVVFRGFTSVALGNMAAHERATINGFNTGTVTEAVPVNLAVPPHRFPQSVEVMSVANNEGGVSTLDVAELGLRFSHVDDPVDDTPPAVPSGIVLEAGNGTVSLDWDDNVEPDLLRYQVYRRTAASDYRLVGNTQVSEFTDVGLHNGFRYFYHLSASDASANQSARSAEVSGVPDVPGDENLADVSGTHLEDFVGFPDQGILPADLADGRKRLHFAIGAAATIELALEDGERPVVTYQERLSSPGVHATLLISTDLQNWSTVALTELSRVPSADGRTEVVRVRLDNPALRAAERVFVRVKVNDELGIPRFAIPPEATTTTTISMTAGEADLDPRAVQYFFKAVSAAGHDSGWQRSRLYLDSGFQPGDSCSYQVSIRRVDPVTGEVVPGSESDPSRTASATTPVSGARPNIIVFMADDLGYECFDLYGESAHDTPRITEMAAQGMKFTNFHAQPLCTPSRVQIMTGQYNQRSATTFADFEGDTSFANFFKQAGYRTCIAGKWQLDNRYPGDPDFDLELPQRPRELGFDEYLFWKINNHNPGSRYFSPKLYTTTPVGSPFNIVQGGADDYGPKLVNDFINDFATRASDDGEPFLIYCPLIDPHTPFVTPPGSSGLASDLDKHKAMVKYMDACVGNTLDLVRHSPALKDNTLVIFTSDNGTSRRITSRFNGADFRGGKTGSFDPGTHVAMVAWGLPQIPAGSVCDDLGDLSDILPTICDLAGVPIRQDFVVDGRSLRSQFFGRSRDPRRWVYGYYFDSRMPETRRVAWVRNKHFKLYQDGLDFTGEPYVGATRGNLYDVRNDERETMPLPPPVVDSRLDVLMREFQAVLDRMDLDTAAQVN